MSVLLQTLGDSRVVSIEERRVIFALHSHRLRMVRLLPLRHPAPFFAALFFPRATKRRTAFAFAAYAAGFLVRPFGALVFDDWATWSAAIHLSGHHPVHGRLDLPSACCRLSRGRLLAPC